jgi:hypothetical protein
LRRLVFVLVRNRYDWVPVCRMWALKVTRSTMAATVDDHVAPPALSVFCFYSGVWVVVDARAGTGVKRCCAP